MDVQGGRRSVQNHAGQYQMWSSQLCSLSLDVHTLLPLNQLRSSNPDTHSSRMPFEWSAHIHSPIYRSSKTTPSRTGKIGCRLRRRHPTKRGWGARATGAVASPARLAGLLSVCDNVWFVRCFVLLLVCCVTVLLVIWLVNAFSQWLASGLDTHRKCVLCAGNTAGIYVYRSSQRPHCERQTRRRRVCLSLRCAAVALSALCIFFSVYKGWVACVSQCMP